MPLATEQPEVKARAGFPFAELGRELRFAARALRRTAMFTGITILSLGLGLALAATTLAITNAYLLRALPFPEGHRLFHVRYAPPGPYEPRGMAALDWDALGDIVEATIITGGEAVYLGERDALRFVRASRVSPGFMTGLRIRPVLGQAFSEQDFKPGSAPVALLGHALWRDAFNSDPSIVGREIRVTPENRTSTAAIEMLVPMQARARAYMIRLREGVPVALAEQRITAAARAAGSDFRPDWAGVQLDAVHDRYVEELRPLLIGINAATALVFVLVCANVAILVLLRALRRRKEMAVRLALGAGRSHLWRLLLAEAAWICAGALTLGVALTAGSLHTVAPIIEARLGRPPPAGPAQIGVDFNVLLMIGGVGTAVALSLAFLPLLASRRRQLAGALGRTGHGATDAPAMRRLRSTLVAIEVAGALVLLAGGGLMLRSVWNLVRSDLGFDAEHVARASVMLPPAYREPAAQAAFWDKLGQRLAVALPSSALGSSFPPFYESHPRRLEADASDGTELSIGGLTVGANYFAVHGIALRQGREFTLADRAGAEPVAVVSESLARQLWPEGSALGRRLRAVEVSEPNTPLGPWRTIIGVARDVRQTYGDTDWRDVYFPFLQSPTRFGSVQVRTDRGGALPLSRLAALVAEIDPFVRVGEPQLLAALDQQFARARFMTNLLGAFAGFGTLLALLGLYGVTAYAVQQREREVAIRIAVGASHRAVVRLFLRQGGVVLAFGIGLGVLAAAAAGRVLASQVHGVQPLDPLTLVVAAAALALLGLAATWWPARRAAQADLLTVLKEE